MPVSDSDRERLIRRWLALVIERSSLEELAARRLGDRLTDMRLLIEAGSDRAPAEGGSHTLREEIDERLAAWRQGGETFTVALVGLAPEPNDDDTAAPSRRFSREPAEGGPLAARFGRALSEAAEGQVVLPASGGASAIVLPPGPEPAAAVVDRLRVGAWRLLGGEGRLADVGLASCPEDGASAHELLAVASERLDRAAGRPAEELSGEPAAQPDPESGEIRVLRLR